MENTSNTNDLTASEASPAARPRPQPSIFGFLGRTRSPEAKPQPTPAAAAAPKSAFRIARGLRADGRPLPGYGQPFTPKTTESEAAAFARLWEDWTGD